LADSHRLFHPAAPETKLPCDYCSKGKAKTVFLAVGIAIEIELLRTDADTDSDLLTYSHRLFNPTTPVVLLTPGFPIVRSALGKTES
jgi:hypothetical protein